MLQEIIETFPDIEFLKADGLDSAVIGFDEQSERLIYSVSKIIEILMADGMTDEDALDHYYYNIAGAYVGEKTPIYCFDFMLD
jgi:hypothetical protein